jgi:hypothetical protein
LLEDLFVEDYFDPVFRDSGAIVADPALKAAFRSGFLRLDDDLAAWGILDRIRDQVLKHTLQ